MKGIMFNEKYGLESAVLNGTKTRTWRADKKPRYEVGEVVAIKQCYCKVYGENKDFLEHKVSTDTLINEIFCSAGWRNKMFVKNELMPHHIRITSVKKCRLQDLTDENLKDYKCKEMDEEIFNSCIRHYTTLTADIVIDAIAKQRSYIDNKPIGGEKQSKTDLQIIDYSDRAVVIVGDTKSIKEQLKELGGRFNARLSCGPGWVFSKMKADKIKEFLKNN